MDEGPFQVHHRDGATWVRIHHPPANLVDAALLAGLLEVLDDLDRRDTRAVVFASADPDFFSMHGDVEAILAAPAPSDPATGEPNPAAAAFQRLASSPYVTIGVIDGIARGGGAELLSALDLRVGSPRTVLGQPEVPLGILPGAGGTARLPHLLGRGPALEVILSGRDVPAEQAQRLGWLDAIHPSADLENAAWSLARRLAAMPAAAIAAVKQVVDRSLEAGIPAGLAAESDALRRLTAKGDHRDRMRRFLAAGGQTRSGETERMAELVRRAIGDEDRSG